MGSKSFMFRKLYDLQANYLCDSKRWYDNPDPAWRFLHKRRFDLASNILKRISRLDTLTLDVGCGEGLYSTNVNGGYVGVDLSINRLQRAKTNFHNNGVEFVLADISYLPFRSNSFDCVFASEVIEHVINVNSVLNSFNYVLKNNGYLFLTTPQKNSIVENNSFFGKGIRFVLNFGNVIKFFKLLIFPSFTSEKTKYPKRLFDFEKKFEHLNVLSFEEIKKILEINHFRNDSCYFTGLYFGSFADFIQEDFMMKIEYNLTRVKIGRNLLWTMFIVSKKIS